MVERDILMFSTIFINFAVINNFIVISDLILHICEVLFLGAYIFLVCITFYHYIISLPVSRNFFAVSLLL